MNPTVIELPPPSPHQPYIDASVLEGGYLDSPLFLFVADAEPTEIIHNVPSFAFFLCHSATGDQIVFDLGIRRNLKTYPPAAQERIEQYFKPTIPVTPDDALRKGGVNPEDVKTIILSHLHWDHVGDPTPFPNATFVLGGDSEAALQNAYPANPESFIDQNSTPTYRPFPRAYDYYGDGSLYIIDAAGHMLGHINVLARTDSSGSWIYLAGDSCHDTRIIMGKKDIAVHTHADGRITCIHTDLEQAKAHISRVRTLYDTPQVEVILAHDWRWFEAAKGSRDVFFPSIISPKKGQ